MLPSAIWYYGDTLLERSGLSDIVGLVYTLEAPPQLAGTITGSGRARRARPPEARR